MERTVQYLLSLNILKGLRDQNLITEEEFIAIDNENKKTFQMAKYQQLDLI